MNKSNPIYFFRLVIPFGQQFRMYWRDVGQAHVVSGRHAGKHGRHVVQQELDGAHPNLRRRPLAELAAQAARRPAVQALLEHLLLLGGEHRGARLVRGHQEGGRRHGRHGRGGGGGGAGVGGVAVAGLEGDGGGGGRAVAAVAVRVADAGVVERRQWHAAGVGVARRQEPRAVVAAVVVCEKYVEIKGFFMAHSST